MENSTNKDIVQDQGKMPHMASRPVKVRAKKSTNFKIGMSVTIIAVALTAIITTALIFNKQNSNLGSSDRSKSYSDQLAEVTEDGNNSSFIGEGGSIEDIANKLSPSVVSIVTSTQSSMGGFFATRSEGAGTGIIVSKNGYILTNKHVVNNMDQIDVVLTDGRRFEGVEVVGSDPLNDIAFLKIEADSDFTPAELGDSTTLRIGQQVIAIGNALGQYQNSVTSGIVSGTNRSIAATSDGTSRTVESLTDMIQTDTAINPGNSGGPLVNSLGQVIGINTAVDTSAQGVGFAIPVGAAKGMLKSIIETGTAQRAYVGVNYIPITADVAREYDLPVQNGAYIYNESGTAIESGGPASKAGLKDKDIITMVGDIEIGKRGSISSLTAEYQPGDTVQLTVIRGEQKLTLDITLGEYK